MSSRPRNNRKQKPSRSTLPCAVRKLWYENVEDRTLLAGAIDDPTVFYDGAADLGITLRQSITQANQILTDGDYTINLQAGTYELNLDEFNNPFSGVSGDDLNVSGDLDVNFSASVTLTIQGAGANQTFIDGNGLDRVFEIFSSGDLNTRVILSGVTIVGGLESFGGGIYNSGTLEVRDSSITGNTAQFYGGGIYNSGSLTLLNSTIASNMAQYSGGGIENTGFATATIQNSSIFSNSADEGGGIYTSGVMVIDASVVMNNTAITSGGGIQNSNNETIAQLFVQNGSVIAGNTVQEGDGGGIYNRGSFGGGFVSVDSSTINGNSASGNGGGLFTRDFGDNLTSVQNSTISNNTAQGDGGGFYLDSGAAAIVNSTISGNAANLKGGGIAAVNDGNLLVRQSTITGNRVESAVSDGGEGGGVNTDQTTGTAVIHNTIIAGNLIFNSLSSSYDSSDLGGELALSTSTYNLIGDAGSANNLVDGVNGNIVGDNGSGVLAIASILNTTLANNGGPTLTHALVMGSAAVDAGDNAQAVDDMLNPLLTDQRGAGFPRQFNNGIVDIGAVESPFARNTPPVFTPSFVYTDEDTAVDIDLWFLVQDQETADADLTFAVNPTAAHGTVELLADGHTVRFTPEEDYFGGDAQFDFQVTDTGNPPAAPITAGPFTVNVYVYAVNDPPSFDLTPSTRVSESQTAKRYSVANFASNMSPGAANESDQILQFLVMVTDVNFAESNPDYVENDTRSALEKAQILFETMPTIDPLTGTLTYKVRAGKWGYADFQVVLMDDGNYDGEGYFLAAAAIGSGDTSPPQFFQIQVVEQAEGTFPDNPPPLPAPALDWTFSTNGGNLLSVSYEIVGDSRAPFDITVYQSLDQFVGPGDTLLSTFSVTDAGDLSVGAHTLTFELGSGPGQLALPGAGAGEDSTDYRLVFTDGIGVAQFAGVYHLAGGVVYIQGSERNDHIQLSSGSLEVQWEDQTFVYDTNDVPSVRIRTHGGNDVLTTDDNVNTPIFLFAGDGNDRAYGGSGQDRFFGGLGNDTLFGMGGNDYLSGDAGHDRIYGGDGNDTLFGWDGNDLIRGDAGWDRIYGGDGSNRLYGSDGNDFIRGGDGLDRIYGEDGDDTVYGAAGGDFIRGGDGMDRVHGDAGNDVIYGEADNDFLFGDAGNDRIYGGDGNDSLYGMEGRDILFGMLGDDFLDGGIDFDLLFGGPGDDILADRG